MIRIIHSFRRLQYALPALYTITLCVGLCPAMLIGQRFPERFSIIHPLSVPSSTDRGDTSSFVWLAHSSFYAGFARYLLGDEAHGWHSPLGAYVEIFRNGNTSCLYGIGTFDHVADFNNDISFNPRAVWWEEGVVYAFRTDSLVLGDNIRLPSSAQIGYFHRCKHDVDNLDNGEGRVLIYGSLTGKYLVDIPFSPSHQHSALFALRTDIYTVSTDYRYPVQYEQFGRSYFNLVASVGANLHYRAPLPLQQLGWYATARILTTLYAANRDFFGRFVAINDIRTDWSISAGISVEGSSRVHIGLTVEYLADPETKPFPSPQHSLTLGFTFSSARGLW